MTRLKPINTILCIIIIIIISVVGYTIIYAQPSFNVRITNIIEEHGGNLKTVILLYPSEEASLNKLIVHLPTPFLEKGYFIHSYIGKNTISHDIKTSDNETLLVFSNVTLSPDKKLKIVIYQPKFIEEGVEGDYKGKFLAGVILNYPISYMKMSIKLPPDTRAMNTPHGYSQYQITPGTVRPQLFVVERTFNTEEISSLVKPIYINLNMTSTKGKYASIKLLNANGTLTIKVNPDSSLIANLTLELVNTGKKPWSQRDYIPIYKIENIADVHAYTCLRRELKVNETQHDYRIQMPYEVEENGKILLSILFKINNSTTVSGLFRNVINYRIIVGNLTPIPMDILHVMVIKYDGETLYNKLFYNITEFHENIVIEGSTEATVRELLSYFGVEYLILLLVLGGVVYTGYQLYIKTTLKGIPPELRKHFKLYQNYIKHLANYLELEDLKKERKISDRDYFRRRVELAKEVNRIFKEIERTRGTIEKASRRHKNIREILQDMEEVISNWKDLQELEEKFRRRRVKIDEYSTQKHELIMNLRMHITRLSKRISIE